MAKNKSVLISVPEDGRYFNVKYAKSGMMTAMALKKAFETYSNNIKVTQSCQEKSNCISEAKKHHYDYIAYPEILQWADAATFWSGIPDVVEIRLTILKAERSREINSVIIRGKSNFFTLGGNPQDLLPAPINNYIASLYE